MGDMTALAIKNLPLALDARATCRVVSVSVSTLRTCQSIT